MPFELKVLDVRLLPDILVVMALPVESQGVFESGNVPVLYTGIGKVNATHALTRRLAEYRMAAQPAPLVVNFGTAGSQCHPTGTLLACNVFIQRDMDLTGLGFAPGVTPFEDVPQELAFPTVFPDLPAARCGSGDSFATTRITMPCEVIDMEGYALAKVCVLEGASFACVKYITDGADEAAGHSWQQNLPRAASEFLRLYRSIELPR